MQDIKKARAMRLEIFIKHLDVSQVSVGKRVGVGNVYINQLLNSHRGLTDQMASKIVKAYPSLSREWLLWGEGEMLNGSGEPEITAQAASLDVVSEHNQKYETTARPGDDLQKVLDSLLRRMQVIEEWQTTINNKLKI